MQPGGHPGCYGPPALALPSANMGAGNMQHEVPRTPGCARRGKGIRVTIEARDRSGGEQSGLVAGSQCRLDHQAPLA
jgi:hypothetical protein